MRERLRALDKWAEKTPKTTWMFFQIAQCGVVFFAGAIGILLEHWLPSKYIAMAIGVPLVTGFLCIVGAFWWLSGKLLEERP